MPTAVLQSLTLWKHDYLLNKNFLRFCNFLIKENYSVSTDTNLLYSNTNWPSKSLCKSFCFAHLQWVYFTAC